MSSMWLVTCSRPDAGADSPAKLIANPAAHRVRAIASAVAVPPVANAGSWSRKAVRPGRNAALDSGSQLPSPHQAASR